MSGGGGGGSRRGVAAPGSANTESGGLVGCREEGDERHKNGLHPGHIPFTYIYIPRMMWGSEPSYLLEFTPTCSTQAIDLPDSPPGLIGVC